MCHDFLLLNIADVYLYFYTTCIVFMFKYIEIFRTICTFAIFPLYPDSSHSARHTHAGLRALTLVYFGDVQHGHDRERERKRKEKGLLVCVYLGIFHSGLLSQICFAKAAPFFLKAKHYWTSVCFFYGPSFDSPDSNLKILCSNYKPFGSPFFF